MRKNFFAFSLLALVLGFGHLAQAQQANVHRVGVILEGGPFRAVVDGLKDGLKDLGLVEGKQFLLEIRDLKGDRKSAEEAAKSMERAKVDVICTIATSVTITVKQATEKVPIVFVIGGDPLAAGLVDSFARPGGRLTGVHYLSNDLTGKRLEILKEIFPTLHKVVTFYDPSNEIAVRAAKTAQEAGRQLEIEIIEKHVASAQELHLRFNALRAQEADAYFYIGDAMVLSQAQFIIDSAKAKKLPTMFLDPALAAQGALVSYGVSYYEVGRLSANYVQRIFAGMSPENLPVERFSRFGLAVNLRTARELNITVPQSVLFRADTVIE